MARAIFILAGALAAASATVSAQSVQGVQRFEGRVQAVSPLRVAPVAWRQGGLEFLGEWAPYEPVGSHRADVRVFDCLEETGDCTGGMLLGAATNVFWTNDMTLADDTNTAEGASRVDFMWFHGAHGSGSSESAFVAVFTQESAPCEPDSFDYNGWLLDFGTLPSGACGAAVDLGPGAWQLPPSRTGSYAMFCVQDVTSDGGYVLATDSRPFLWATGEDRGDPAAPGTQGPWQFDDDAPADGVHTPDECHSYTIPDCPYEVGPAAAFWGVRGNPCLGAFPNCDGNDVVNTLDFLCFLGTWSAAHGSGNYDPAADCNADGEIDTLDFLCFLGQFTACFS